MTTRGKLPDRNPLHRSFRAVRPHYRYAGFPSTPLLPVTSHQLLLTAIRAPGVTGATGVPGVFTAAAALGARRPLRGIQSDLVERWLPEARPRLGPTVQLFGPAQRDRRLPRSA